MKKLTVVTDRIGRIPATYHPTVPSKDIPKKPVYPALERPTFLFDVEIFGCTCKTRTDR